MSRTPELPPLDLAAGSSLPLAPSSLPLAFPIAGGSSDLKTKTKMKLNRRGRGKTERKGGGRNAGQVVG